MFVVFLLSTPLQFIFMTLSTYGLALPHIRLASLLSFSGVEDIMVRSLKSFAGIALRHLSSTEVGTKGLEWSSCSACGSLSHRTRRHLSSVKLGGPY